MYDVFLSYSRDYKEQVERIAVALRDLGVNVFFDLWKIDPGDNWIPKIEIAIKDSRVVAVVIAPGGISSWAELEKNYAQIRQREGKTKVIPVLLPGVKPDDPAIPGLLRGIDAVAFSSANDTDALTRLYRGIKGQDPPILQRLPSEAGAQTTPEKPREPKDEAIRKLVDELTRGNITFFVGRNVSTGVSPYEISERLLRKIHLVGPQAASMGTAGGLLLPMDLAASYYRVQSTDNQLEDQVVDIISRDAVAIPSLYQRLAELLQASGARGEHKRGRRPTPQLVITSNFDILLEKALLSTGLSFTRLVKYRSTERVAINKYINSGIQKTGHLLLGESQENSVAVDVSDPKEFEHAIKETGFREIKNSAVQLDELVEPILYKLHGSQDRESSCTISTEQYYDEVVSPNVPEQVKDIIATKPMVFLNCGVLDSDFRLSYMLLRIAFETGRENNRYAIYPLVGGDTRDYTYQMSVTSWQEIKDFAMKRYGIQLISGDAADFLRELRIAAFGM